MEIQDLIEIFLTGIRIFIKAVMICQTIHRGLMIVSASIAIMFLMVSRLATQIWTLVSWSVQNVAGKWA